MIIKNVTEFGQDFLRKHPEILLFPDESEVIRFSEKLLCLYPAIQLKRIRILRFGIDLQEILGYRNSSLLAQFQYGIIICGFTAENTINYSTTLKCELQAQRVLFRNVYQLLEERTGKSYNFHFFRIRKYTKYIFFTTPGLRDTRLSPW